MNIDPGIGASIVPQDANEAIADLNGRKTLIALPLNTDIPSEPEFFKEYADPADPSAYQPGPENLEMVFNKYQPSVEVEFEDLEGDTNYETLSFTNLADFGKTGITAQSNTLKSLNAKQELYQKVQNKLKSDKRLQSVLDNPEMRAALIGSIEELIKELES